MTPDFIWMVVLSILGIGLFFAFNWVVWTTYAWLHQYVFDGEGIQLWKIFPLIGMLILGAWKVLMFVLMAVGAAFAISSHNDKRKVNPNRW